MRDLRAAASWLVREISAIGRALGEWELWAALAVALLLWALAYQAPFGFRLDFGGDLGSGRRYDDDPFLGNSFNKPEPPDQAWGSGWRELAPVQVYRWTAESSTITLPGIGAGDWLVSISAGAQPGVRPTLSRWSDGVQSFEVPIAGAPQDDRRAYHILARAPGGDLALHLSTPPFAAPNDPRSLGFRAYYATITPVGQHAPPASGLALLALALALFYLLLRRLALSRRPALALALALAALAALLLARERMALTLLLPRLPLILAGCYGLGLLLDAGAGVVERQAPAERAVQARRYAIGLVVLAAALRLGGMLHPHARFSDDGLNANNLIGFTSGSVYFTEDLPSESGGGAAPYPPGQYIVFAPAQLLIQARLGSPSAIVDAYRVLLRIANALWDSLAVGLIYYLLLRSGYRPRTALLSAALYVLPPPILKSLSVGEFANVFGQGLALPLLALLACAPDWGAESGERAGDPSPVGRRPWPALVVLLVLALLGHLGASISLICLLACLSLGWMLRCETRPDARALVLAGLLAAALLALFYYTPFLGVFAARLATPSAQTAPVSLITKLLQEAGRSRDLGLQPLALALGGAGLALLAWRRMATARGLGVLLLAWLGGTLLSLGLLLFASQGVRWQPFLYPALCLAAGPALAALAVRGRAGRTMAASLLAFLLWYGLAFWVAQIADYLH